MKNLSQKIEDGIKQCKDDLNNHINSVQKETQSEIEKMNKVVESNVDRDFVDKAVHLCTETITEGTYASKIKSEVDQHLIGMDS